MLRSSEKRRLNEGEQQWMQTLTIVMVFIQSFTLAAYIVTGNRWKFLRTYGTLAWLNHLPSSSHPTTCNE